MDCENKVREIAGMLEKIREYRLDEQNETCEQTKELLGNSFDEAERGLRSIYVYYKSKTGGR